MIAAAFLCLFSSAIAQNNGGGLPTTTGSTSTGGNPNGSFYDYSAGSLNIEVNIWGFVGSPGKYKVPSSTKLIQLISLAGGPTDRARLNDIRILHDLTVDSTITDPVVIFNLDEYQKTGDPNLNPILIQYDTIVVPGDALNVFQQILSIIGNVSVFLGFILSLYAVISK
jgi:hypothetical protein